MTTTLKHSSSPSAKPSQGPKVVERYLTEVYKQQKKPFVYAGLGVSCLVLVVIVLILFRLISHHGRRIFTSFEGFGFLGLSLTEIKEAETEVNEKAAIAQAKQQDIIDDLATSNIQISERQSKSEEIIDFLADDTAQIDEQVWLIIDYINTTLSESIEGIQNNIHQLVTHPVDLNPLLRYVSDLSIQIKALQKKQQKIEKQRDERIRGLEHMLARLNGNVAELMKKNRDDDQTSK